MWLAGTQKKFESSWLKTQGLTCPEKGGASFKLLNPARDLAQHLRIGFIFVLPARFLALVLLQRQYFVLFGELATSSARLEVIWVS